MNVFSLLCVVLIDLYYCLIPFRFGSLVSFCFDFWLFGFVLFRMVLFRFDFVSIFVSHFTGTLHIYVFDIH